MPLTLRRCLIVLALFFMFQVHFMCHAAWVQPPQQFTFNGAANAFSGATDGNGNAITIWSDVTLNAIQASYYDGTLHAWGPALTVSNVATEPLMLSVAMDATGTGIALWREQGNGFIRASRFASGVWTMTTPDPIDAVFPAIPASQIMVSMNGSGGAVGAWVGANGTEEHTSFFNPNNPAANLWGSVSNIGTAYSNSSVSYSASGKGVAIFLAGTIASTNYYNGTNWVAPIPIGFNVNDVISGIDSSGNAIIGFVDAPSGSILVYTTNDGGTYTPSPQNPIAAGVGNTSLSLAVAEGGTAVLTWIDASSNGQASTFNGSTWSAPIQYATNVAPPPSYLDTASVAVDSNGNALVVYGTNSNEIFSTFLPLGGAFEPAVLVASQVDNLGSGLLSVISGLSVLPLDERGFAFWFPNSQTPNVFASVTLPNQPAPPSNLTASSCKNKFAVSTDLLNILTWTPSIDPLVVSYNLRRDGRLIANIPASDPPINFDHNRCKKRAIYSLTAVNESGIESVPISVTVR